MNKINNLITLTNIKLMKKSTKIITGAVIGGVVTAIATPLVLPVLGTIGLLGAAGTGTVISTLSGAALTIASCAAVTGTIASTTATITTAGAVIGGVVGAMSKNKKIN